MLSLNSGELALHDGIPLSTTHRGDRALWHNPTTSAKACLENSQKVAGDSAPDLMDA